MSISHFSIISSVVHTSSPQYCCISCSVKFLFFLFTPLILHTHMKHLSFHQRNFYFFVADCSTIAVPVLFLFRTIHILMTLASLSSPSPQHLLFTSVFIPMRDLPSPLLEKSVCICTPLIQCVYVVYQPDLHVLIDKTAAHPIMPSWILHLGNMTELKPVCPSG